MDTVRSFPATMQTAVREAVSYLQSRGIPSPRLEAEILLAHVLDKERIDLYRMPERKLNYKETVLYWEFVEKRASGIPMAYLRGKKEFFSLEFTVGPGVLVPRAETETLIEQAVQFFPKESSPFILDLGTGSGNLIVTLLLYYQKGRGVAVDISSVACKYAQINAKEHGVKERITFVAGDFLSPLGFALQFDLVVSNPPYIPSGKISEDLRFEPREAFDGGPDGLRFYREILESGWKWIKPGGYLLLEIGSAPRPLLEKEMEKFSSHYTEPQYRSDLAGHDRCVFLGKKK